MDEMMKGKPKTQMKKPFIKGDPTYRAQCHPIIRPRGRDLELTREPKLFSKLEHILLSHSRAYACWTRGD